MLRVFVNRKSVGAEKLCLRAAKGCVVVSKSHILTTGAVNKDIESERKFENNIFCNTLTLLDVLPNFCFHTSGTNHNY